jgi:hypothetical protein
LGELEGEGWAESVKSGWILGCKRRIDSRSELLRRRGSDFSNREGSRAEWMVGNMTRNSIPF